MSLISELKRRNVFRVAVGYVVLSWLLLQVADLMMQLFGLPDVWGRAVLALLLIGFIPALIVSWIYKMTPDGLKREKEIPREASITAHTGRKLDVAIIALLVVAIGVFAIDRFVANRASSSSVAESVPRAATATGIPVVAVLPLQSMSRNEDGAFLAAGLHDDLLTRLARLKAFRVISRTSVMEYAETTKNVREIGAELGAGYILEGGLQAIGGNVRINAQLIDAATDQHLWAETFDRPLTTENLFDVQADIAGAIAGAIANAMHAALSPQEADQLDDVPTRNFDAYQSYLQGIKHRDVLTRPALQASTNGFRAATELDPDFAEAWAELAIALLRQFWEHGAEDGASPDLSYRDEAEAALAHAKALAPGSVMTLLAEAYTRYYGYRDYSDALIWLGRAEAIAPNDPRVISLRGYLLRRLGRFDESADALLKALQLDPNSSSLHRETLVTLGEANRCADAIELRERAQDRPNVDASVQMVSAWLSINCERDLSAAKRFAMQVDVTTLEQMEFTAWALMYVDDLPAAIGLLTRAEDNWIERPADRLKAQSLLAWLYRETGQVELAAAASDAARELSAAISDPGTTTLGDMALASAIWGGADEALDYGRRTLASAPEDALTYQNFAIQVIHAYAVAGLTDDALDVLEDTLANHHFVSPGSLALDPMLDAITATDRFRKLVGVDRT